MLCSLSITLGSPSHRHSHSQFSCIRPSVTLARFTHSRSRPPPQAWLSCLYASRMFTSLVPLASGITCSVWFQIPGIPPSSIHSHGSNALVCFCVRPPATPRPVLAIPAPPMLYLSRHPSPFGTSSGSGGSGALNVNHSPCLLRLPPPCHHHHHHCHRLHHNHHDHIFLPGSHVASRLRRDGSSRTPHAGVRCAHAGGAPFGLIGTAVSPRLLCPLPASTRVVTLYLV
ncbi:hypothetical protein C8Q73DRAFT_188587 [Cubamyces lactineus]|nr:hypothetical protein C8Q73DRAFT_188587 [Cubamyces lactineus]